MTQAPLPPTIKPNWIGGHFRSFMKDRLGFLTNLSKLGDVSHFKMSKQLAFFINHPDLRLLILPEGWEGRNPLRKDFEDAINMIKL